MDSDLLFVGFGLLALFLSRWMPFFATKNMEPADRSSVTVQIVISIVVLAAALYVIAFKPDASDATQKWAIGAVGTLFGFWLKRP